MVRYAIRYQSFHLQLSSLLDSCSDQSIQLLFITNGPCCFLPADICSMSTTNYINLSQLFLVLFATVTRTASSRQEFDIQCFPISGYVILAPYFFDVDTLNDSKGIGTEKHSHRAFVDIGIDVHILYIYQATTILAGFHQIAVM